MIGRLIRALRRQGGATSVEFALVFPVLMALVGSIFEAGIATTRQVMLERALDLALRDLRLGVMPAPSHDGLRRAICARTAVIRDCEAVMLLELRPIDTDSWAGLATPIRCIDRSEEIAPVTQFRTGGAQALMLVRACVIVDPVVPVSALALALPRDGAGGYRLLAASVFVNEPV